MVVLHAAGVAPLWTAWSVDPLAATLIPLAALLYARGLRSLGPHRHFHAGLRPWSFYGGLAVIALALVSPLDALTDDRFWAHMTQHVLLMLVGVPLVLLGAPVLPMMRGVPRGVRRRVAIPTLNAAPVRIALRVASKPLVAFGLLVSVLIAWHVPNAYEAAVSNGWVHTGQHVCFAISAYLFWWNVVEPVPLRPHLAPLVRVPYVFVIMVPNFVLSAFLTYAPAPWYAVYTEGVSMESALADQQAGGLIMWIPGSFIMMFALLGCLAQALRQEERRQREREGTELSAG
ncbi:MAG: cytochrome c oxidase assembly protein [Chloroflexota bacterium]